MQGPQQIIKKYFKTPTAIGNKYFRNPTEEEERRKATGLAIAHLTEEPHKSAPPHQAAPTLATQCTPREADPISTKYSKTLTKMPTKEGGMKQEEPTENALTTKKTDQNPHKVGEEGNMPRALTKVQTDLERPGPDKPASPWPSSCKAPYIADTKNFEILTEEGEKMEQDSNKNNYFETPVMTMQKKDCQEGARHDQGGNFQGGANHNCQGANRSNNSPPPLPRHGGAS